jgi:hypothetical protein
MVDSTPAMLNVFSNDYIVNSIYPIIATLRERDSPVSLVQDTRYSSFSDPKYRIYGLLSMLPLKMRQGIHANYGNTKKKSTRLLLENIYAIRNRWTSWRRASSENLQIYQYRFQIFQYSNVL